MVVVKPEREGLRSFGYAYNHMLLVKAFYGRLKPEENVPVKIDLAAQVVSLFGFRSPQVYRERFDTARSWGIAPGFVEFLYIRHGVRYPGHYLGLVVGFLTPSPTVEGIIDLHRQGPEAE